MISQNVTGVTNLNAIHLCTLRHSCHELRIYISTLRTTGIRRLYSYQGVVG